MALTIGTRLGSYEIQSALGAGGMGEVYKARDTRLDRIVAIKVLLQEVAAEPDFRQRFEREARAVAALNHPHVCTLYDIGHQDGIDFLVMVIRGESASFGWNNRLLPSADSHANAPPAPWVSRSGTPPSAGIRQMSRPSACHQE